MKGIYTAMEDIFINSLNSVGLGTVISVIIVGGGIIAGAFGIIKKYNQFIAKKTKKEEEDKEMRETIQNLTSSLQNIQSQLNNVTQELHDRNDVIDTKLEELKESIESSRKESNDGDQLIEEHMKKSDKSIEHLRENLNNVNEKTDLLIESDKESIKAMIIDTYYECKDKKYIEVYKLQSLEPLYDKYLQENGNTFIGQLMADLRKLPHEQPIERYLPSGKIIDLETPII